MQRWNKIANVFIVVALIGMAVHLYVIYSEKAGGVLTLEQYAQDVVKVCLPASNRQACYDAAIPQLMPHISLEEAFAVSKIVQRKDPSYLYCHVLGHRLASQEVIKDPENWKSVIPICLKVADACLAGCIHGAVQEKFKAETLSEGDMRTAIPELREVCTQNTRWDFTPLQQMNCFHALGHLAMYITGGDIKKSLSFCKEVAEIKNRDSMTENCYSGVFMTIYQPLEPEDKDLVLGKTPSRDTAFSFCMEYEGKERSACWRERWPLFSPEIYTAEGLQKFCAGIPLSAADREKCFFTAVSVVATNKNYNTDSLKKICDGISDEALRGACIHITASRMVQINPRSVRDAVSWCASAHTARSSGACYKALTHYALVLFHPASAELFAYCSALPEPWSTECRSLKND